MIRVIQGIVLGAVLSVPVVLWGLSRAEATAPDADSAESGSVNAKPGAAGKPGFRKVKPAVPKKPVRLRAPEVETIPASQMHVRVDDGSRAPSSPASSGKADIE